MSWNMDDCVVGGQFMVGAGTPLILGVGPTSTQSSGGFD